MNTTAELRPMRNYTIDLVKFLASFGIIAIHTELFRDVNETLYFFAVQIVARLSVPFFAVCSGFYAAAAVTRKQSGPSVQKTRYWKQWSSLIVLYLVWTVLYLLYSIPAWMKIDWTAKAAVADYCYATLFSGSYYHLWYLLSLIYAWPLYYMCRRFLSTKAALPVAALLWMIEVWLYAYSLFFPGVSFPLFAIIQKVPALRDAVFRILPLLLLGGMIRDRSQEMRRGVLYAGLLVSIVLLIVEAAILNHFGQDKLSYLIMTFPTAFFLFSTLISAKALRMHRLRSLGAISTIVYCVHPMLSDYLRTKELNSVLAFVVTTAVSSAAAVVCISIKERKKHQQIVRQTE